MTSKCVLKRREPVHSDVSPLPALSLCLGSGDKVTTQHPCTSSCKRPFCVLLLWEMTWSENNFRTVHLGQSSGVQPATAEKSGQLTTWPPQSGSSVSNTSTQLGFPLSCNPGPGLEWVFPLQGNLPQAYPLLGNFRSFSSRCKISQRCPL